MKTLNKLLEEGKVAKKYNDKMFKAFYGLSQKELVAKVVKLADDDLKIIASSMLGKEAMATNDYEVRVIRKEMHKRGLKVGT